MGREYGHGVVARMGQDARMHTASPEPHSPEVKPKKKSSRALSEIQVSESEQQGTPDQTHRVSKAPPKGTQKETPEKKLLGQGGKQRDGCQEKGELMGFGFGESVL